MPRYTHELSADASGKNHNEQQLRTIIAQVLSNPPHGFARNGLFPRREAMQAMSLIKVLRS